MQVARKELKAYKGEDTQAENSEDHHIGKFPNRLDKCIYNDFQT